MGMSFGMTSTHCVPIQQARLDPHQASGLAKPGPAFAVGGERHGAAGAGPMSFAGRGFDVMRWRGHGSLLAVIVRPSPTMSSDRSRCNGPQTGRDDQA